MSSEKPIARVINATKKYKTGDQEIVALGETSLTINTGQLLLIIGPSGSGKTTLLSLLGCVINPTAGEVEIGGTAVSSLSAKEMARIRLNNIGFVFQSINLIAPLTALENVMLPLELKGISKSAAKELATEALGKVNMLDRKNRLPKELSGGQQQRVGIARALVTEPPMILADEPTASLDSNAVHIVMDELKELSATKAVVVVTHDYRLKGYADKIIRVENGKISEANGDF
jgi:putative ABC transport system ATP-binding protein